MSAIKTETLIIGGGIIVGGFLLMKLLPAALKGAGGLVTGNNPLTQNAKNADGTPQTAYQGAGVAGTLGAGANAASGGLFGSIGDWLGGHLYDATHSDPLAAGPTQAAPPSTAAATDKYTQGGNASTGSGSFDYFNVSPPDAFGDQWGS